MNLIVDTHVHIYPFYAIELALQSILDNFNRIDSQAVKVACLTERYDCDLFNELASNPPESVTGKFDISVSESGNSLRIQSKSENQDFHLLPGQQIITAENLEILSLNCRKRVVEGNPAEHTINDVLSCGGIPVVAWGLGKWLSKRGDIVGELIDKFAPHQLAVGDTTMRPYGWLTPLLMKKAENKGYKILFGSDPLPFPGEETRPGSYASKLEIPEKPISPEESIRSILTLDGKISPVGNRCSILEVGRRTLNHRNASKAAPSNLSNQQS
jgi:hypothetical protein